MPTLTLTLVWSLSSGGTNGSCGVHHKAESTPCGNTEKRVFPKAGSGSHQTMVGTLSEVFSLSPPCMHHHLAPKRCGHRHGAMGAHVLPPSLHESAGGDHVQPGDRLVAVPQCWPQQRHEREGSAGPHTEEDMVMALSSIKDTQPTPSLETVQLVCNYLMESTVTPRLNLEQGVAFKGCKQRQRVRSSHGNTTERRSTTAAG